MRNITILLSTLLIALTFADHGSGQMPSLGSIPAGEKFTSEQCGFTIAMPPRPTATTATEENALTRAIGVYWKFQEGAVIVQCGEFVTGGAKVTEKDAAPFIDGLKARFLKGFQPVSSFTEAPYKLGDYSGKTYSMLYNGNKIQLNIGVSGNKFFAVMATALKDVPGSDALVFSAADSFRLIAAVRIVPPRE